VEYNPNHPVTREVHDQWHKIVALIMLHFGITEFRLTDDMIRNMPRDIAVVFDSRKAMGDAVVKLVSMSDAIKMAKNEGGLPH